MATAFTDGEANRFLIRIFLQYHTPMSWRWVLLGGIAVMAIGGAIYIRRSPALLSADVHPPTNSPASTVSVAIQPSDPTLGDSNAPVQVIEFSDFTSADSADFHAADAVFSKIKQTYIDTGKVYYVFKEFPLVQLHPESQMAALAAACAQDQGKFWDYADLLFTHQDKLDDQALRSYAKNLKLDEIVFSQCLTSHAHEADITANIQDGLAVGVIGTPTVFVNGQLNDTDVSWPTLQAEIEQALPH